MLHYTDTGNWGGGYPDCGAANTQVITWGGPIAVLRWDNIDDMDVKDEYKRTRSLFLTIYFFYGSIASAYIK